MARKISAPVSIGGVALGRPGALAFIAGPCVIESREHTMKIAEKVTVLSRKLGAPLIFKSSYTKANRTSAKGFRGFGMEEGLTILAAVRKEYGVPVVSDVHTEEEAKAAGEILDLVQIPAFLCRQTSLLDAAGRTGKPVMIKKGQFLAPEDMRFAAEKVEQGGSKQVLLCERGACFGYRDLVVDFRSLQIMSALGYPVVFDATHSVQSMGGQGGASGGRREFIPGLARAAVAFGVDAIFLECHDDPDNAPSDGPNMLPLAAVEPLLTDLKALHEMRLNTRNV